MIVNRSSLFLVPAETGRSPECPPDLAGGELRAGSRSLVDGGRVLWDLMGSLVTSCSCGGQRSLQIEN